MLCLIQISLSAPPWSAKGDSMAEPDSECAIALKGRETPETLTLIGVLSVMFFARVCFHRTSEFGSEPSPFQTYA